MPFSEYLQRKEGDSNPRYGNPYDSLANCWFQPLTHPSLLTQQCGLFQKDGAKIDPFSIYTNVSLQPYLFKHPRIFLGLLLHRKRVGTR